MNALLPYLKIQSPDGELETLSLTKTFYKIGRLQDCNDIALPEEEGIITRMGHCILEREAQVWGVTDKSTNGTIIEREDKQIQLKEQPNQKIFLSSGDRIIIHHWQLQFFDPNQTTPINLSINSNTSASSWLFKRSQLTFYKMERGQRIEVPMRLSPKAIQIINCLAAKNLTHENTPTICQYDELIEWIWPEDSFGKGNQDINTLAKVIRVNLEEMGGSKEWLETKKTVGYILRISCEA